MTSCRNKLAVCASSDGGPDLNLAEHNAGNSTFGTAYNRTWIRHYAVLYSTSPNAQELIQILTVTSKVQILIILKAPRQTTSLNVTECKMFGNNISNKFQTEYNSVTINCLELIQIQFRPVPPKNFLEFSFLQAGCTSCRPTNNGKAVKDVLLWHIINIICMYVRITHL